MNEATIRIPVGDWVDEYMEHEANLSTEEDAIEAHLRGGLKPQQMGRLLAIAKQREEAFEAVALPKPMLNVGYAAWWSKRVATRKVAAKMPSGKTYDVREFVGQMVEPGGDEIDADTPGPVDDEPAFVPWQDDRAISRAVSYLCDRVPAYIMGRMKILAGNDATAEAEAARETLHDEIDRIWALLFEPQVK